MESEQDRWDLVVINPSFVLGPAIDPQCSGESFSVITQLGDGTMKTGAPDLGMGMVDVRDLAEAHFRAGFTPGAEGRNIISAHNSSILEMARLLHDKYGDRYPIPSRKIPKWLLWLVGPVVTKGAMSRKMISLNVGYPWQADNAKSVRELGMTYRAQAETLVDMFRQMTKNNRV